jgi:hypothetical protein
MAHVTGDPKVDVLLAKHAEEIKRSEAIAKELAEENNRLIAKIKASRAKPRGVAGAR